MSFHPSIGQFVQRDPLEYVDGGNLYQYERGDPSTLDPTGQYDVDFRLHFGGDRQEVLQAMSAIQARVNELYGDLNRLYESLGSDCMKRHMLPTLTDLAIVLGRLRDGFASDRDILFDTCGPGHTAGYTDPTHTIITIRWPADDLAALILHELVHIQESTGTGNEHHKEEYFNSFMNPDNIEKLMRQPIEKSSAWQAAIENAKRACECESRK